MISATGKRTSNFFAAILLLALAAVLAVACGAEDPTPDATGPSPQADATAAPTAAAQATAVSAGGPTSAPAAAQPAAPTSVTAAPTAAPPAVASAAPSPTPPGAPRDIGGDVGNQAPELMGTQEWINSGPLTLEELRGKVVLIDFWTYTCVNCLRTLPYLQQWYDRYEDDGLVIVGVHTPEFEFEKDFDNVVQATVTEGVDWPVVQDNEFAVWRSFSNRYWPAKYLIDRHGVVRYRHFGEGKYGETEDWIRTLLQESGATGVEMEMPLPEDQARDSKFVSESRGDYTPELFAGWQFVFSHLQGGRGPYIGQREYYENRETVVQFQKPDELEPHLIYFQGPWYVGPQATRHAVESTSYDDYLALVYSARSVNAVLTSESGEPYKVRITVNGDYLTEDNAGGDIMIGEDGESYLWVDEPRLYKIVESPNWMARQELRMASMSNDFGLFSFTFGVYESGF